MNERLHFPSHSIIPYKTIPMIDIRSDVDMDRLQQVLNILLSIRAVLKILSESHIFITFIIIEYFLYP